MSVKSSYSQLGKVVTFMVIFMTFYYPIGVFFITQFSLPSTVVNFGIRLVFTLAFVFLICIRLVKFEKSFRIPIYIWFLLAFWVVYSCRILYDLSIGVRFSEYSVYHVLGFAFGNILIPILTIILYKEHLSFTSVPNLIFKFLIVANALILACYLIQNNGFNPKLLLYRPHIYISNDYSLYETPAVLNPIQIGYYGNLLALCSFYFIWFKKDKFLILARMGCVLGLCMLILGASRGPFASFILSFLILLFYKLKNARSMSIQVFKVAAFSLLAFFGIKNTAGKNLSLEDLSMFNRISSFVESRQQNKTEARDVAYRIAWQDFLENPVLGRSFVSSYLNHYPHNIIIEVFMATGIIGASLFFSFFLSMCVILAKVILHVKNYAIFFLAILLIPILIGNLFSGALFQSIDLWIIMVLFLCFYNQFRKRSLKLA